MSRVEPIGAVVRTVFEFRASVEATAPVNIPTMTRTDMSAVAQPPLEEGIL